MIAYYPHRHWLPALSGAALLLGLPLLIAAAPAGTTVLFADSFDRDLAQWSVEQMPGGTVTVRNGALDIHGGNRKVEVV